MDRYRLMSASLLSVSLRCIVWMGLVLGSLPSVASAAEPPRLTVSLRALELIARAVLGDTGTADRVVSLQGSPHEYVLTPSEASKVRSAPLLYWLGADFEPYLAAQMARRRLPAVDLSRLPGLQVQPRHDLQGQVLPGTVDGHVWLDPLRAARIAERMAEDLGRLYPAQRSIFQRNAARFLAQARQLLQAQQLRFHAQARQPWLAWHDSYRYLAEGAGLGLPSVISLEPEQDPGAAQWLRLLQHLGRPAQPVCLAMDPGVDPARARPLSVRIPLRRVTLDTLGGTAPEGEQAYWSWLQKVYDGLYQCLGKR